MTQPQETLGREPLNYVEGSAWEGLTPLPEEELVAAESVVETMERMGLDWEVQKVPLYLKENDRLGRQVKDRCAILKKPGGDILGTAGKLFTPIQNVGAFSVLQHAVDKFGARVETAGALNGGARVWMLLSLRPKRRLEVVKGDGGVKPYFLVSNAHTSERSQALQARFTSVRVWCANTLEAAIRASRAAVSIPHHKSAVDRLNEIEEVVKRMYQVHEESVAVYQGMASVKIGVDEAMEYYRQVFRLRDANEDQKLTQELAKKVDRDDWGRVSKVFDARDNALWLLDNGKGTGRTAWGAYNSVTEYIDHVSILKKDGHLTKNGFETAAFGYGAYQKQKALDLALARWMKAKVN